MNNECDYMDNQNQVLRRKNTDFSSKLDSVCCMENWQLDVHLYAMRIRGE